MPEMTTAEAVAVLRKCKAALDATYKGTKFAAECEAAAQAVEHMAVEIRRQALEEAAQYLEARDGGMDSNSFIYSLAAKDIRWLIGQEHAEDSGQRS